MTETNRYNNGKIYKLVSPHSNKIYVGSTCKKYLCQRLSQHKSNYKEWIKNEKIYISSFELFELGDVEIVLLESVNCETKDELFKKEREYIDKYKDIIVNKLKPSRTRKEKNEQTKKYRAKNKEKMKQYREENKERIKKYYEDNKEKINKTYECECGSILRIYEKTRHLKSLKHQKYLNSLQT
jgi:hypothetical protein